MFPIVVSKDALMQGLHYHAMRLQSRSDKEHGGTMMINPYDESQFTRPVRLHRRSARDKMETLEQSDAASGVEDKEREVMNARRAERQAEREANQALIAPTGAETKKRTKKKSQKKVEDVYYDENDPKQRQRAQLRYEEARPWHLEDFDNKNVWVGSYEEPLTETSVMFEIGEQGFKMVPVERWYKFTQTNRVSAMDSDAVEKHMGKKFKAPRWFLGTQEANDDMRRQAAMAQRQHMAAQMRRFDEDDAPRTAKREEYRADVDEIDFEFNDEFQDDDEGFIFGDQEVDEAKEIEKKIRDEMREANLGGTGVKDEDKDWDAEEQKEKVKEQEERRRAKRIRKQLIKKERKNEYDSESERNEFSESSESEDSEEERERAEEEKKQQQQQEEARKLGGDKSGASTRGTNTPSGRSEKRDVSKLLAASLKRPGSPDLSELSGNESSRKKAKGVNGRALSPNAPNGARSLSRELSRQISPSIDGNANSCPADSPKSKRAHSAGYGSGSETDTSRTGRPKLRLKASPPGSPHEGSRAGSPSGSNSRAQSPSRKTFPTLEEVRAAIPAEGIAISEFMKLFKPRIAAQEQRQADFFALVKQAGRQDPGSKKIYPREV